MKGLWIFLALLVVSGMLAGCGGGGGSTASSDTVSGVASVGAAMTGTVSLKDAKGSEVTAPIGSAGAFSVEVDGLTAPFLLKATADNGTNLYSFAEDNGTANINPMTNIMVILASGTTDLNNLFENNFVSKAPEIAPLMPIAADVINSQVSSLLGSYDTAGVDCLKGHIEIGKGIDAIFDAMKVEVGPDNVTVIVGDNTKPFMSIAPGTSGTYTLSVNSANLPATITTGITSPAIMPPVVTTGPGSLVPILPTSDTTTQVTPVITTPTLIVGPITTSVTYTTSSSVSSSSIVQMPVVTSTSFVPSTSMSHFPRR